MLGNRYIVRPPNGHTGKNFLSSGSDRSSASAAAGGALPLSDGGVAKTRVVADELAQLVGVDSNPDAPGDVAGFFARLPG